MPTNNLSPAPDLAGTVFDAPTRPLRRILIADDDSLILYRNAEVLIRHGFEVDVAENGAEAWEAIQLDQYDLLITDNNMPELSGLQLVKKVYDAGIPLPVIMASGTVQTDDLDRHSWFNIEAVLHKPYTAEMLVETVKNVLLMTGGICDTFELPPVWHIQPPTDHIRRLS